jgi:hypothetical protein
MGLKDIARHLVLGTALANEYVCTSSRWLDEPLRAFLKTDDGDIDVTGIQVLLGYKPLTMGLAISEPGLAGWAGRKAEVELVFRTSGGQEVASLSLARAGSWRMGDVNLVVYRGIKGAHRFLTPMLQTTNRIYEWFRPSSFENGALSARQYDQVRIAYSVIRRISIISLGDGKCFNFFPTDLQGEIGPQFYTGSLRIGGKACSEVETLRKVVVSTINASAFRETYALAKNHMADLRTLDNFSPPGDYSERWNLPLPQHAIAYKELSLRNSWDSGIHRVHFYEVVNEKTIDPQAPDLGHIHKFYAQWRLNNGLKSTYLIR